MTLRVTGLLHYGLEIPDLAVGRDFYDAFGLECREDGSAIAVSCDGRDQEQTLLLEGPQKRIHHVSFAAPAESLPELKRHLESQGVELEDAPAGLDSDGVWFRDLYGNRVNVEGRDLAPAREVEPVKLNLPGSYTRFDEARWPHARELPRPRRLSHMLLFSADVDASREFYERTLGLRLSDRIPGLAVFMNSGPGDHHVFGFIHGDHSGLHHSSWEVNTFDELAVGAQNMADKGYDFGWGLGRHSLGSNLFHYIRDPWGSWMEYTTDLDQITDNWKAQDWEVSPAVWCPSLPPEFLQNHEPAS